MPELPEVETVVRDLRPQLVGRRLIALQMSGKSMRRAWSPAWEPLLLGRRIAAVLRRGKWIILELKGDFHLVIHLGMTGQLTVRPRREPIETHTHFIIDLTGRRKQLRFRDIRRFGSAVLFEDRPALERFFNESGLGPEPSDLDDTYLHECLAKTSRCLKAVLLDQRVVAGVGNIYADESLFHARLHPAQLGRDTSAQEARRLRRAIVHVLDYAIDRRGSSIRDYVDGSGAKGRYQDEFRVYGRAGSPCPRCRTPIARIRLAGRSTHFCPQCQRF